jgi:hypothetical protein
MDASDETTDGAVWRLRSNFVRFFLSPEKGERLVLPDKTSTPSIPDSTPNGLNGKFGTFLFYPKRIHCRQISQLAAYTVHPNPSPGASGDLCQALRPEEHLTQYVVPAAIKHKTFAKLWSLGIRYENIFPDAEGAAKGAKYVVDVEDNSIYTETITFGARTPPASGK